MTTYYQRFRDPRVNYVMIVIGIEQEDGTFGGAFHVRITEEEYENLEAQSRRQFERNQWPGDTRARGNYRPPGRSYTRSEPGRPFEQERPTFTMGGDNPSFSFFFDSGESMFEEAFRKEQARAKDEERKRRQQQKEQTTAPKRNDTQARMRLAELAGVEWPTELENMKLYRRAQRKCHPDIEGGTHELWIELESIAAQLRLIKRKDTTGSNRYAGRSGG